MVSPTECLWHYCGEFWIFALAVADIVSDFLYFEELYVENKDVPIIVVTTAIQAYLVGYDVREWHPIAIVSYVFSLFAMQQKAMKLGLAKDVTDVINNRVAERQGEIGPCFWWVVLLRSIGAVILALLLSWAISLFIIFFAPDPPE
eukprot:g7805.t2